MTDEEVRQQIDELRRFSTDHRLVEAKRAARDLPKSIPQTLSAFSNAPGGGTILFGVDETQGFLVSGVEDPKKVMQDLASATQQMQPALTPPISLHEIDGKHVISCAIPELPPDQKPCYIESVGEQNGTYFRVADGDQQLRSPGIRALRASRHVTVDDRAVVQGATLDDLDPELLTPYLARVRAQRPQLFAHQPDIQVLRRHHVVGPDDPPAPTVAGLLAFGLAPDLHLPQLGTTVVTYAESRVGAPDKDGVVMRDNVAVRDCVPRAIGAVVEAIRRNSRVANMVVGGHREHRWEFPEQAIREAVTNALVHRDLNPFAQTSPVQVQIFPDRLVITNPGGLYGPIQIDGLGQDGSSSARNQVLVRLLEDVIVPGTSRTVIENRGSGVGLMLEDAVATGVVPPTLEDGVIYFRVTFPRRRLIDDTTKQWLDGLTATYGPLTDTQRRALTVLSDAKPMTRGRYRQVTRLSAEMALREMTDLMGRGLVEQPNSRHQRFYLTPLLRRGVDAAGLGETRKTPDGDAAKSPRVKNAARVALPTGATRAKKRTNAGRAKAKGGRPRVDQRPAITAALRAHGPLARRQLEDVLDRPRSTVARWLQRMMDEGTVVRLATDPTDPNARYQLADRPEPPVQTPT